MSTLPNLSFNVIRLNGGKGVVGTDRPEIQTDGESPARKVTLKPFGISDTTITNNDFARFIAKTGYITDAEQLNWSYVFRGLLDNSHGTKHPNLPWWNAVEGAKWDAPLGPGSDVIGLEDHPVIHVSFWDARAFAKWAGGRLPSEAEWEHAGQGGSSTARYPWGDDEPSDDNANHCNIWQGIFPSNNTLADEFYGTAPARSFPPNAYGLYNLSGNVWEWCDEPFRIRSLTKVAKQRNIEAKKHNERILKGGSFLCHTSTCWRYRIAARSGREPDNSTSNCGFRVAFD
ncbi:formylglycine-generating enzyme family protein [Sulfitobacter sp.]|uniref:formylglycine-generating enzyme family protein n=1 Tax=Sulfitobacter sp. TaxID=1903071 RepID=UPI003001E1DA